VGGCEIELNVRLGEVKIRLRPLSLKKDVSVEGKRGCGGKNLFGVVG